MSLAFVLDHRADVDPDGDAISDGSQSLTNHELLHRVRAASRHLRDLGVRHGDVVALKLTNRIELVVLLFAAWRLGAAVAPIDPSLTDGDVDRQLDDAGARLLVTEHTTTEHTSVNTLAVDTLNQCLGWEDLPAPPDPSALALLIYTSGTTGGPKGVMLDHAKVDAMAAVERDALELGSADRRRLNLPLFHVNGIVVSVLTPLLAGASIVIADRFDPKNAIGTIDKRELCAAHELSNGSNR
jgi:acyl-CoA synthetase (AMP-forming)/AMP-acid ligase II